MTLEFKISFFTNTLLWGRVSLFILFNVSVLAAVAINETDLIFTKDFCQIKLKKHCTKVSISGSRYRSLIGLFVHVLQNGDVILKYCSWFAHYFIAMNVSWQSCLSCMPESSLPTCISRSKCSPKSCLSAGQRTLDVACPTEKLSVLGRWTGSYF